MTTEEILQECKNEIARKYKFSYYSSMTLDNQAYYMEEAMQLYAQKIAELFAEWTSENYLMVHSKSIHAWVNYKENIIYTHGSDTHYLHLIANKGKTTYELYTEFLNQLNSAK